MFFAGLKSPLFRWQLSTPGTPPHRVADIPPQVDARFRDTALKLHQEEKSPPANSRSGFSPHVTSPRITSVKQLENLTANIRPDELKGAEQTALLEFRRALQRRADGKPDGDWRS